MPGDRDVLGRTPDVPIRALRPVGLWLAYAWHDAAADQRGTMS